jgi:dipeptidyl aminopeptidase/acylaminoacyl peptidase
MHFWTAPLVLVASLLGPSLLGRGASATDGSGAAKASSRVAPFSRHARFVDAKISPDGTYLAAISNQHGKRALGILNLKTRKLASAFNPDSDVGVGDFYWTSDEQVVIELIEQESDLAAPKIRGEIYALNASGRGGELIAGGSEWSFVLDANPDHPLVIVSYHKGEVGDRIARVYRLDGRKGGYRYQPFMVTASPIRGGEFLTDENGDPRIAFGLDAQVKMKFFYRERGQNWRELTALTGFTSHTSALGFVARDRIVYVSEPMARGFGVYSIQIDTGERRLVSQNNEVPPRAVLLDRTTGRIIAVEYEPDLPVYEFVDEAHPLTRVIKGLQAAYPAEHVRLVSTTRDDKMTVAHVFSDRDPGRFLLVDVDNLSAEPIVEVRPWIDAEAMAEKRAFHIAASDGLKIHGYLTLPPTPSAGEASPPPLVVLPHGGPHFVRDHWHFDPDVQLLAASGFAVLQVNYRGSGGYGLAYQEGGYRRWGDRVVQDIVDATRWAIRKGYADPKRICAYGASFGGYAAMQSAIIAPDLFRCAAGYAGIYDLRMLSGETYLRSRFLRTVAGEDAVVLESASPARNADKLTARVLLIHGKKDTIAPLEHAERLRQALLDRGRPPDWLIERNEGHGFYDEGARERMYARLLVFLQESTKAGQVAGASGAATFEPR